MSNYQRENLLNIAPEKVPAGTLAVKVGDDVFTAGNVKITGTDVSETTATAPDVLEGKQFYNAQGVLTQGTLIPQSGGSTMDFYKCAVVAEKAKEPIPEPIFVEKFNGYISNRNGWLQPVGARLPEYSTIDGRLAMKCDYDHRLSASCDGLPSGNSARTMSVWIYANSGFSSEWNMYCGYGDLFSLRIFWGDLLVGGSGYNPYHPMSAVAQNQWQHIVITFDGEKVIGYVNNEKSGEVACTMDTIVEGHNLCVGHENDDGNRYSTDGYISDLQIYDVALSAEQVAELYQSQKTSLIFHAPLSSQSDTALTGQTLNVSGEVSYTNFNGVDCVLIPDQYNYIYFSDDGFPSGDSDRTICCRMCTEGDYTAPFPFCGYGYEYQQSNFYMSLREGTFGFDTNFVGAKTSQAFDTTVWNFYAVRVKDGQVTAIVNDYKEELSHDSFYTELNGRFQIGRWCDHTAFGGRMYICDVQVYNTALSDDQLMKLYDPSYEPEAPLPPNTWNGYKAVLVTDDEDNTYYEFEETLTKGLTYGNGFIPVVGKIYDTEAMIMATLSEKNKYPEIASPMDMTGYTKDDWIVSSYNYRFDSTKAWYGFYPNGIWAGDGWLQWQNTAQQVLIRQLTFGYGGNSNWIYSCRLDGSDDGEHWTEIGTRDCEYDSDYNTILTFPDNNTAYYYHRLVVLSSNGCAVVYKLLAKRDIDGKNTP